MADCPTPSDGVMEIDGEIYNHLGTLKDDAFARTELLEKDGKKYLYKVSRLAIGPFRLQWMMNKFTAHEARIHHLLEDVHGTPVFVKQPAKNAFIREFVEGRTLDRNPPPLRRDFFDEFHEIVKNIHERGVAFVDLAKKENVVVTNEGRPFLIDFQISIAKRKSRLPFFWVWNVLVSIMQRADIYHVYKHKHRIRPDWVTPEEMRKYVRKPSFNRLHKYIFRKPYHIIKRSIIPKGGDSKYPIYENEKQW